MRSIVLKIGSILFLLALNSLMLFGQSESPYNIRNFSKQTYDAENQNWSITRDQNGFVYVANNIGLLVFDGVEWMFYPAPNGTVIRSVAVDEQNRVFTSGYREIGYWESDQSGKLTYTSLNHIAEPLFSKNEEFWNTVIVGGKVYFRSFASIFIYDYNGFSVARPGGLISSISNIGGELCLHIYQRGLFLLENDTISEYLSDPEINNSRVHFSILLGDSGLLIGTESNGLFIYKDKRLLPFLEDWKPYFSENKINRGLIAKNGSIVIGTLRDGISIFNRNGILEYHIDKTNGLQNNTVLGIESDRENNIWLSLDQGVDFITFLVDPSYTYYPYERLGAAIYAASLYNGKLYICTNQGVFYRDWKDNKRDFRIIPGTEGQVWNSGEYEGQLIISHNEGSFLIKDTTAEKISNVSGGLSIVRHPSKTNMLVQSTYNQIVFYDNSDNKWRISYNLPGFNDLIRYIEFDHVDNLWASHMHQGVFQIQLNDSQDSVLTSNYFGESVFGKDYDIQVFKIENRIIFTTGKQIFTYNDLNDSIIEYDHLNQKLGDYASSHRIIAGPDHHYWFISKTGIALFRIFKSGVVKIKGYPINLFKDHLIIGYENILPLSAMEGLLCLDNGYAILRADKSDLSQLIADKKLSLNKIELRGRSGKSETLAIDNKEIRIPHKKNSLTLSFAFPLFSNESIEFQYYIEGLDASWSEPFEKPVFDFTRIPFGDYIIRVRAFNEWNITSEVEAISLTVSPLFT